MNCKNLFKAATVFALTLSTASIAAPANPNGTNPYSKKAGEAYAKLPDVKKGGTLYTHLLSNPKALNPFLSEDIDAKAVLRYLMCRLMEKDSETGEYFPLLAEKVEVSKDHKVITYTLRKEATWEDGTPVTTEDAEFTYNTLMDPKVEAAPERSYLGPFKFEKVDQYVFRLIFDNPNVNTLLNINDDFVLMQKKQYAGVKDFNKSKGIIEPVGNGPYKLKSFSRDQKIEMERRKDWWGYKLPQFRNMYNFDTIVYRIIPDTALAYEKFMKGEIDVFAMNAELFGTRVKGSDKDKFGTETNSSKPMWAKHFRTQAPAPWTYIGWNLKRPMFQSKKTRQALAQLIDYDQIINKVYHGEGIRCVSPFGSETPNSAPDQKSKAFKFNTAKALEMLKADGWADTDGDNVLDKVIDGKKVKFEFVLRYNSENPMRAKVSQMIKEQFKKAGITVNVQAMEWNTHVAEIGNRNFDAIVMGWGNGNMNADAKQLWRSTSYENKGSNYTGYNNPEVDKLIDESEKELDPNKRFKITQKIGAMIYDDQPYAFIVEIPGFMLGVHSKIKAKKWAMRFDSDPPLWMYSAE
jgi:ABC-type transport system substrate-binding protein